MRLRSRILLTASLALATALAAALASATSPAAPPVIDRMPGIAPAYAVEIDGRLTWGANLDAPRPPASLVKLLTALTLLQDHWEPRTIVQVSRAASDIEGSQVGLHTGERLYAEDLLTAMLVRSANDACLALVEHAAGTMQAFLPRLNARARELGLTSSEFRHPCGLDADGTHTTVRDLLRVADAALLEPRITVRSHAVQAHVTTLRGRDITFHNSNALIGRDPDAVGLKSGYTQKAGRCLIAVSERDGHRVVLAMLGAEERWWAASNLLAMGLAQAAAGGAAAP